jgi:hypothetical protein
MKPLILSIDQITIILLALEDMKIVIDMLDGEKIIMADHQENTVQEIGKAEIDELREHIRRTCDVQLVPMNEEASLQ